MKSIEMRKNILFTRNNFPYEGKWQIPKVDRQYIDLKDVSIIS